MPNPNPYDQFDPQGGMAPLPSPPKPPSDRATSRQLSDEEVKARGLDPAGSYQINSDGEIKPISDPNKNAKPTEFQSKSAGFLGRLVQAEKEYTAVPYGSRDPRTNIGQWFHEAAPNLDNSLNTADRQKSDQAAFNFILASLRQESGAAISAQEYENQYRVFFPVPGDSPQVIKQKAEARRQAIKGFVAAAGTEAPKVVQGDLNDFDKLLGPLSAYDPPGANPPPPNSPDAPPPPPDSGVAPRGPNAPAPLTPMQQDVQAQTPSTGGFLAPKTRTEQDWTPASQMTALLRSGADDAALAAFAKQNGWDYNIDPAKTAMWRKYYQAQPNTKESAFDPVPHTVENSTLERVAGGAPGAFVAGVGNGITANTLDNMAGVIGGNDLAERFRRNSEAMGQAHPVASTTGEITGGVAATLGGEAALARAGVAAPGVRSLIADTGYGAASGAGGADYGSNGQPATVADRFIGAGEGGLAGMIGHGAGKVLNKGVAAAINPTGGSLADLYAAGVKPTIGQRLANAGDGQGIKSVIGKAVNAGEEALQSVPLIGSAIRGARQEARDQFQLGAFNESLKEIGAELPKGMKPGTDPHKFAQEEFGKAYDTARNNMQVVGDPELQTDMQGVLQTVSELGPQSQAQFNVVMKNKVNPRIKNGTLSGPAYKTVISDIGKKIRAIRDNPNGDHELAGALQDLQGALEANARRHSPKEAVELLDAADAGYAKLVRIEDAASRVGGDAGTFTPSGFDRAVQKTSGGIRSKAYLRGDALMEDYAKAGRSLEDRLPNSGTTDRALAATIAGGAAYVSPATAAFLATMGAAYAPGVRKVMQNALAPGGANRKALQAMIDRRARLMGAAGAATGAALLPQSTAGQ